MQRSTVWEYVNMYNSLKNGLKNCNLEHCKCYFKTAQFISSTLQRTLWHLFGSLCFSSPVYYVNALLAGETYWWPIWYTSCWANSILFMYMRGFSACGKMRVNLRCEQGWSLHPVFWSTSSTFWRKVEARCARVCLAGPCLFELWGSLSLDVLTIHT